MNSPKSICVYCASSDAISQDFFAVANELGAAIARADYTLIYGGGEIGLMGELARSVHSRDGRVVGVIPEFLRRPGISYESADELIVTVDMRERKAIMESRADAFIALPGGFGTLEEMLEIITLKQLGIINKPMVFLNTGGFYNGLNQVFEHIFDHNFAKPRYRELYHFAQDVTEAMEHIESYEAPMLGEKWL
ncbi:TIGR00730 family Rossman fold protein [bacterium]|nr:TIGR00730 family Rossman fold protein [bacterium]